MKNLIILIVIILQGGIIYTQNLEDFSKLNEINEFLETSVIFLRNSENPVLQKIYFEIYNEYFVGIMQDSIISKEVDSLYSKTNKFFIKAIDSVSKDILKKRDSICLIYKDSLEKQYIKYKDSLEVFYASIPWKAQKKFKKDFQIHAENMKLIYKQGGQRKCWEETKNFENKLSGIVEEENPLDKKLTFFLDFLEQENLESILNADLENKVQKGFKKNLQEFKNKILESAKS